MKKFPIGVSAIALAAILVVATPVAARTPTAIEKAELAMLSPAKQKEVLARATGGNTVSGVIETMLLNQLSADWANGDAISIDFVQEVLVVRNSKGQLRDYEFDSVTLTVTPPAPAKK
ncbi:MAG: hypothetical protein ACRCUI_01635 [Polymorphobacter sp.]